MYTAAPSATRVLLLVLAGVLGLAPLLTVAQPGSLTLRLASIQQWSVSQHRAGGRLSPELRAALDGGVVDRPVFWWQRGAIQRSSLAPKPVRVVPGPEATLLGGLGEFELVSLRTPSGAAGWTQIEVRPRSGQSGDVLVLQVGGELNTVTQVLETLLVISPDGSIQELPLARRALASAAGVPVMALPIGQYPAEPRFTGQNGVEFFVARSPVETLTNGDTTPAGPADRATSNVGDWREADRVFIRVPVARLQGGLPGIVLGWKDRTLKPDPDGGDGVEQRRRS
jgi:hypothetical protein